jgi:hypothetical protein
VSSTLVTPASGGGGGGALDWSALSGLVGLAVLGWLTRRDKRRRAPAK